MTDLTPERRAELRRDAERRRLFRFVTGTASDGYPASGFQPIDADISALLDAADERDRLADAVRQIADACHWSHDPSGDPEALVAHIGQLQQIAEDACDERDRLAAAVERVRALAENWRYKGEFGWGAWQEGHGPDETGQALDDAACSILRALDRADDE